MRHPSWVAIPNLANKQMNKFPRIVVVIATLFASILLIQGIGVATPSGGTLRDFFASHGFGGAPLERRPGNHLFVSTNMNGRRTALLVDSGAPITLIDRNSVETL